MIEIEKNKKNLEEFLKNIRKEDKEELEIFYGKNYKKDFIDVCMNKKYETYFLADKNLNPVAIGGVVQHKSNLKLGQIWLLTTDKVRENKFFLFKYVKNKIKKFKTKFDVLFNYIYKSNFKILLWLNLFDFESVELKNKDFKFFYYKKEGVNFDTRYFTD